MRIPDWQIRRCRSMRQIKVGFRSRVRFRSCSAEPETGSRHITTACETVCSLLPSRGGGARFCGTCQGDGFELGRAVCRWVNGADRASNLGNAIIYQCVMGYIRFDFRPIPSAIYPCESVVPIRLRPDFFVVFEGYAGGAIHRRQRGTTEISLSGAVFSEPHHCADLVQSLYRAEFVSLFKRAT